MEEVISELMSLVKGLRLEKAAAVKEGSAHSWHRFNDQATHRKPLTACRRDQRS